MIQFNYNEIKNNRNDRNDTLRWLVLNFVKENDLLKQDNNFAPEDGNFELRLTVKGNYEMDLDVEKLLKKLINHGKELEEENRELKDKLNNIRYKINQFIDEEAI